MKRKWTYLLAAGLTVCLAAGCGSEKTEASPETAVVLEETNETGKALSQAETPEVTVQTEVQEAGLQDVAALLGMKDEDTAELFGGGAENWTEDKSFYIGRIYTVDLYGESCQVFTTCGADKTVESISIWIVNGNRDVTEEEAKAWESRVTEFMKESPVIDGETSEGGSKNYRWRGDGLAASMHQMKDILSVSLQPAVGELDQASAAKEQTAAQNDAEETTGYADNFAVDSQAAASFAEEIKTAVAEKDLEKLADLSGFPVYVGLPEIGGVETREDFLALGSERIFTEELLQSVASADTANLEPSRAGFVLTDGSGANIVFGVRDGALGITGINY